jgi:ribosomal protein S13
MILRRDEFICDERPCIEHEWVAPVKYGFDAVGALATVVAQVPYTLEYEVGGEIRTKKRMKIEVFSDHEMYHMFRHYTSHTRYSDNGSLVAE